MLQTVDDMAVCIHRNEGLYDTVLPATACAANAEGTYVGTTEQQVRQGQRPRANAGVRMTWIAVSNIQYFYLRSLHMLSQAARTMWAGLRAGRYG